MKLTSSKRLKVRAFSPTQFLATKGEGRSIREVKKDACIYTQGEPGNSVYYIQKGRVKLIVVSAQGKEATVALFGAKEFIGEDCVTGQDVARKTSAIAMTACTLMRIDRAEMIRVLHAENSFSDIFIAYLLFQNSRIQSDYVDQLFNTTEKRLARTLLQMVNFGVDATPQIVVPKISQQMLSEMIGCTRSRVSFFMNRFRKQGFIDYNGTFTIHSTLIKVILQN